MNQGNIAGGGKEEIIATNFEANPKIMLCSFLKNSVKISRGFL
jgi:hypothetical protein